MIRSGILRTEISKHFTVHQFTSEETIMIPNDKTALGREGTVNNSRCVKDNNYNKPYESRTKIKSSS